MKTINLSCMAERLNSIADGSLFEFASLIFQGPFFVNEEVYEGGLTLFIGNPFFCYFPTLDNGENGTLTKKSFNLEQENVLLRYCRLESIGFYESMNDINMVHLYNEHYLIYNERSKRWKRK